MGILTRFKDIMAANINALLDKAEDPEKMIDQLMRNLTNDLAKVKDETAGIIAEEQRCKRAVDECQREIDELQKYAVKAIEANNDGDAKKFLSEKAAKVTKLNGLTEAYQLAGANAAHMREMHDKLVGDIEELKSRRDIIKGKMAVAKTQQRINQMTASSVDSANDSITSFQRLEERANKELDKANAMADLNKSVLGGIENLKDKYDVTDADLDEELAALKASLGK